MFSGMIMFYRLRDLIDDMYSRVPFEDLIRYDRTVIVGMGGMGQWFTLLYSMLLTKHAELVLIDDDILEPTNLNRFPFPWIWSIERKHKVDAIAEIIMNIRPQLEVLTIKKKLTSEDINWLKGLEPSLVVETIDSPVISELIRKKVKEIAPVLSLHYDGRSITVEWTPQTDDGDGKAWIVDDLPDRIGYQTFPSLPYPPIIAAVFGLILAKRKPKKYVLLKINDVDKEIFNAEL